MKGFTVSWVGRAITLLIAIFILSACQSTRDRDLVTAAKLAKRMGYAAFTASQMYEPRRGLRERVPTPNPDVGGALFQRYEKRCQLDRQMPARMSVEQAWRFIDEGTGHCGHILTHQEIADLLAYIGYDIPNALLTPTEPPPPLAEESSPVP